LALYLTVFKILSHKGRKLLFSHTPALFDASAEWESVKIQTEKSTGMGQGLENGKNYVAVCLNVFG